MESFQDCISLVSSILMFAGFTLSTGHFQRLSDNCEKRIRHSEHNDSMVFMKFD